MSDDEYLKMVSAASRTEITNEVLQEESDLKIDKQSKMKKIIKNFNIENMNTFVDEFPNY